MGSSTSNPDALPQPIGEYRPVDEWQAHLNKIFYGLQGHRLREFYQTFAAADYRLAHALAADYYDRVVKREQARISRQVEAKAEVKGSHEGSDPQPQPALTIMEWGCGNGNLAACFLSHLKTLDADGCIYPRLHYVLVDTHESILEVAKSHPDLVPHRERVGWLQADVQQLSALKEHSVDRIICNELWNDLPTKLMLRREGDVEEEYIRPNLSEKRHAQIDDWTGFVRAFEAADVPALKKFPAFLEDIIWEREYRKVEWKAVPYRKTITAFLKHIDEHVLIPVNTGASLTIQEAKRLLAPDAIGFSVFDAGTADLKLLNEPDKPCYGQVGGQYSFMVNFALLESVAKHEGFQGVSIELQREFVGRNLGANVITLMDLLATHPEAPRLKPWEQEQLIIQTIRVLNEYYRSPYERTIEFPLQQDMPSDVRERLQGVVATLRRDGVPDTIAYLTEFELLEALTGLEELGYERSTIEMAMIAPHQEVDYCHLLLRPSA
jgi:hypothetical protein